MRREERWQQIISPAGRSSEGSSDEAEGW